MKKEHLDAWAAGVLDGEGCVALREDRRNKDRTYYRLEVIISQAGVTKPPMIELLEATYGGKSRMQIRVPDNPLWEPRPMWSWKPRDPEEFLQAIAPYACQRKDQVELALLYCIEFPGWGSAVNSPRAQDLSLQISAAKKA